MSNTASDRHLATELRDIEELAVEFADIAGAEITRTLGTILSVRYKPGTAADAERIKWRDSVSEVDQRIESIVRRKLADHFPDHDIIGEEIVERPSRDHEFVWAIDPIDGTANFVNGFPIFSASIGVLHRGRPRRRRALVLDQPRAACRHLSSEPRRQAALRRRRRDAEDQSGRAPRSRHQFLADGFQPLDQHAPFFG